MSYSAINIQPTTASDLYQRLFDLTYVFARKNGYVFSAWDKLSIIEHQIITELDQRTPRRPSDLARRVNFPPAQLARVLRSLEEREFLRFVPGETDREKLLLITREGRACAWAIDDHSNHQMNLLADAGVPAQQAELYTLWETINNELGAPRTVVRPGDHPLRFQSRRSTRYLQLFRSRSADGEIGYPDLHILLYLHEHSAGLTIDEITATFRSARATLKNRLIKLHELGLCTSPSDKRGARLLCTPLGLAALNEARQAFALFVAEALAAVPSTTIARFYEVANALVSRWKPEYDVPRDARVPAASFFLPLQVQALIDFARHEWGVLQPTLARDNAAETFLIVAFEAPTPCFAARVRRLSAASSAPRRYIIEECGYSDRVDWAAISERIAEVLTWVSANELAPETVLRCAQHTPFRDIEGPRTNVVPFVVDFTTAVEPLRDLLSVSLDS